MLMRNFFFMQMNRIIRFDLNFLPLSQRGRLSVGCDEGTDEGTFIMYHAAQSVCRQIKLKIDNFTNVYYTWNVYLAT